MIRPLMRSRLRCLLPVLALGACIDQHDAEKAIQSIQGKDVTPDQAPIMRNGSAVFHVPPALYQQHVQGNVVLHLRIDAVGAVVPESTSVLESSGYPSLDSAAVQGSHELVFTPAKLKGRPLAVSVKLPVFFRHPKATPLPGDSVLHAPSPQAQP